MDLIETRSKEIRKYLLRWSGIRKDRQTDRWKGMENRRYREKGSGRRGDVLVFSLSL